MDLLQIIQIECGYFSEMVTLGKSLINDFKSGGMTSPDIDLTTSKIMIMVRTMTTTTLT